MKTPASAEEDRPVSVIEDAISAYLKGKKK